VSDDGMGLIRALGFVAWSDRRISSEEKEILTMAMDALGIPAERRLELCAMLRGGQPSLEGIAELFSDETERRFAMAQAIMLAQADGHVVAAERRDLNMLARALGIADDELQLIYAAVDVTRALVPDALGAP
jgi:tellurite resistance protein